MMVPETFKEVSYMNRFRFAWFWGLATAAIASIVGVIAYNAGHAATVVTTAPGGSEVVYHGYYGWGFFPFFGLFWLLLILFIVSRFFFWRPWGRGPWGYGGPHYHDHTHDQTPSAPKPQDPSV
jgi:hypothetical protein